MRRKRQPSRKQEPLFIRSMQRAAVNIYKTDNSFEMLVFAPGRIKEHFQLNVKGQQLTVSYSLPEGFPRPEWIQWEYSRGGFSRTFTIDESIRAHHSFLTLIMQKPVGRPDDKI